MVIFSSKSTFGRITKTQVSEDLPGSGSAPLEIELNPDLKYAQLVVYISNACYITVADDATEGATRVGAAATRNKYPAGWNAFPVIGSSKNLYVKSTGVSAVTEGVSYYYVEADDAGY